jgi:hypothetical protein
MTPKIILVAFLVVYRLWLIAHPARTAGLGSWQDCMTVKGLICVPKLP